MTLKLRGQRVEEHSLICRADALGRSDCLNSAEVLRVSPILLKFRRLPCSRVLRMGCETQEKQRWKSAEFHTNTLRRIAVKFHNGWR